MMPGHKKFQTKQVSKQIQSARLSFANEEYLLEFLDITPGSVSVMGLMNDKDNRVQLLVDEDILESEYFGCHPCINTSSLRIKVTDLTEKILRAIKHEYIPVKLIEEV
jgi:Ala-tRNA(Pro) deacylase